jgi:hypothetical protein
VDPNDYIDPDLDRPGIRERFSAWLDWDFNRAGVRPFRGTDREALEGRVTFVSSAEAHEARGDSTAAMDQGDAALRDRLRELRRSTTQVRSSAPTKRNLEGRFAPGVAPPSSGTIARPRAGTIE